MIDFKAIADDIRKYGNWCDNKVSILNRWAYTSVEDGEQVANFLADFYKNEENTWISENYGLFLALVLVVESGDDLAEICLVNLFDKTFNCVEE